MKAVVIERQGGVEQLNYRDWPDPVAGANDVLVAVRAVGLNHLDIFVRKGMPGFAVKTPFISGGDIAGVIVHCGESVRSWRPGDRVAVNPVTPEGMIGEEIQGGMADLVRVPTTHLIRIPANMDYATAAAIPISFGTALRMLETIAAVKAGELVLILGASGGVGTACIQLSKYFGARVIAVTHGARKRAALSDLGADYVIDGEAEAFSATAWRISGKRGVDVVINYTGGDTWVPSLKALRHGGRLVTCGATAGYEPKTDIRYIWVRELKILGANGYTQQDIERGFALIEAGSVKPLIARTLHMSEAREAHRLLEEREAIGKVVLLSGDAH